MSRGIRRIMICLLLGVVTTVAVAFGLAGVYSLRTIERGIHTAQHDESEGREDTHALTAHRYHAIRRFGLQAEKYGRERASYDGYFHYYQPLETDGVSIPQRFMGIDRDAGYELIDASVGFPFKALMTSTLFTADELDAFDDPDSPLLLLLAWQPAWPGLIADSLLFAGLWCLLIRFTASLRLTRADVLAAAIPSRGRLALRVFLVSSGGVVLTVGISWGAALVTDWGDADIAVTREIDATSETTVTRFRTPVAVHVSIVREPPVEWIDEWLASEQSEAIYLDHPVDRFIHRWSGHRQLTVEFQRGVRQTKELSYKAYGWSMYAFWHDDWAFWSDGREESHVSEPKGAWRFTSRFATSDDRELWIPYRIVPSGFLTNTVLFGSSLFTLLFVSSVLRRGLRRRRGRCPMCGYDLRDDLARGCSECGWNREEINP